MPFKISEMVHVDDSVSSFDSDETTMEETSMILLGPRKEDAPSLTVHQQYGSDKDDNADTNEGSFVDPDETMMTLSPRDFPRSQQQQNQPQREQQLHQSISSYSSDKENGLSQEGMSVNGRLTTSPPRTQADFNHTSQNFKQMKYHQTISSPVENDDSMTMDRSSKMSSNERVFKESYQSVVTSIIAENTECIRLPNQDHSASIDDRISNLYRFMETGGMYDVMTKLGVPSSKGKGSQVVDESTRMRYSEREGSTNAVRDLASQSQNTSLQESEDNRKRGFVGSQNDHRHEINPGNLEDEDFDFPIADSEPTVGTSDLSRDHSFNLSNAYDINRNPSGSHTRTVQSQQTQCISNTVNESKRMNHRDSVSPIELPRHCTQRNNEGSIRMPASFQSPSAEQSNRSSLASKKRVASTSGKKGADIHRMRLEDEASFHPIYEEFSQQVNDIMHSPIANHISKDNNGTLEHSPHVDDQQDSSFLDSALFSQSPIPHRNSILTPEDESMELLSKTKESTHLHSQKQGRSISSPGRKETLRSPTETMERNSSHRNETGTGYLSQDSLPPMRTRECSKERTQDPSSYNQGEMTEREQHTQSFSPDDDGCYPNENSEDQLDDQCNSIASGGYSIESVDSDILREQGRGKRMNDESIVDDEDDDERNINISLKDTSRLYYDPLQVYKPPRWAKIYHRKKQNGKRSNGNNKSNTNQIQNPTDSIENKPKPLPTMTYIQDPFQEFGSRDSDRLEVVSDWLTEQDAIEEHLSADTSSSSAGKAIVLSTTNRQILSLSLQVLLKNGVHKISRYDRHVETNSRNSLSSKKKATATHGGTLVVARSKDELVEWECSFRENTGFTVLNHSALTSKERRRVTMPKKASGYDVVLSTYDALKTKEMSTIVDDMGRVADQTDSEGGWFTSRMACSEEDQYQSSTLSQLHSLNWTRLIMIDSLGRQSYLTKPGTARAQAVAKLKAGSR